ncbi:hypothetical protein GCM10009864_43660 [Streptomyces lunalinharesii]|uniref:Uncharacterized protein n=1 Tax=Streptomyces lunalinharesii TaxID=333384 RepID=A0ABN3S699_9ACTN
MAHDGIGEQPMKVLVHALGQAPSAGGGAGTPLEGALDERGRWVGCGESPTTGSGSIRRGVVRERTGQGGGGAAYGEGSHR